MTQRESAHTSSLPHKANSVRYKVVLISVLMAFGLYLTRVSIGEIVKSDSFLEDQQLVNASTTRFSLELQSVGDEAAVLQFLKQLNQTDFVVVKTPMSIRDGLTKSEAERLQRELELAGGNGSIRISKQQIGGIMGVFFFTYALLQVPAGWLGDRVGARKALSGFIFLWSVLTAWTGFVSSLSGLLIARLGFGLAQAGAYPTSSIIVKRWFPLTQRGLASSLIAFGGRFGGATAPFLTMFLILNIGGWRPTLWLYGLSGLTIAILYFLIVRDRPSEHAGCNEAEQAFIGIPLDAPRATLREDVRTLGLCFASRNLWLNSTAQFCINMGWAFLVVWLPTYLKEVCRVPEQQGAVMVSVVLAMGMIGQLIGGRAADWCVERFGLRYGRVLPMFAAYLIASGAFLCCLGFENAWGIVACCAVVSLMTDIGNPSIWAFMQDVGGRNTGAVFGWGNMWGNFGASAHSLCVPVLVQWGTPQGWGYDIVFVVCAASFFVASLCALAMNGTKPLSGR